MSDPVREGFQRDSSGRWRPPIEARARASPKWIDLLIARCHRVGVSNSPVHAVRSNILGREDAVAVAKGDCRRVRTMVANEYGLMTAAMPLPATSGEGEQAASP